MDNQLANVQGLPTDRNTINKLMSMQQPGINNPNPNMGNNPNTPRGALSGPAAAAMALTNYQNIMMRQNSMNSNQQEASSSLNHNNSNSGNPSPSSSFQGGPSLFPPSPMPNQPQQQQSQGNPGLQQHQMIEQLLKGMSGNNNAAGQQKPTLSGQNTNNPNPSAGGFGYGNNGRPPSTPPAVSNVPGGLGPTLSKSSSFKAANSEPSAGGANGGFNSNNNSNNNNNNSSNNIDNYNSNNQKAPDMPQNLRLTDDMVPDLPHDFAESGFFSNDLDDNMGYGWKA